MNNIKDLKPTRFQDVVDARTKILFKPIERRYRARTVILTLVAALVISTVYFELTGSIDTNRGLIIMVLLFISLILLTIGD